MPRSSPCVALLIPALLASAPARAQPPAASPSPWFVDAAAATGLDFVHFNGMSGELYFPEIMGPGVAFLDYDGDGDLDVYCVQGAMLGEGKTLADATFPPAGPVRGRLFRNDLALAADGTRRLRFVDVTEAAGLDARGYGMGVAVGDFDDQAGPDLFLTGYGWARLYRNRGDGRFEDVTAQAGVAAAGERWGVSASFFDYDRDGRLDLYVANYVDFSVRQNPACYSPGSRKDYCGPADFPPQADLLFHNLGDGGFADVSLPAGIGRAPSTGLGTVALDADGDGWLDLYVANDGRPNQLWMNQRDGTFRDDALLAGTALNREGKAEASMGVDAADFDADGDEDLVHVNLTAETNTLLVNDGQGLFADRSLETGVTQGSLPFTSFGTAWVDLDGDGELDLPIVSGAVRLQEEQLAAGDPFPVTQHAQLYRHAGGRYVEATAEAGPAFAVPRAGRGLAVGDVDGDGDVDLLIANDNGPVQLLLNQRGATQGWLGLAVVGGAGGRDLLGSRIEIPRPGGRRQLLRVRTDGSYASARDPRLLVGLGASRAEQDVRFTTVEGRALRLRRLAPGAYWRLVLPPGARQEDPGRRPGGGP